MQEADALKNSDTGDSPMPADAAFVAPRAVSWQRGVAYMLLATACFSLLDMSAKLMTRDMDVIQIVWGRYLFNFLLFAPVLLFRGRPARLIATRRPGLQIVRSVFLVGSTFAFWVGLKYLPLAQAVTLGFASPLLVTAFSVPMLGERVGVHRWSAVLAGLAGVLIVVRPGMGLLHWAVAMPLVTALCYALYQILTRVLSRTDEALTSLLYGALGGMVLTSLAVPFVWVPPTPEQWLALAWLGLLGGAGHFLLIRAFTSAPASVLAPFNYSGLLWATLLGWLAFGDLPDGWTAAGAALIIASGLYILHRERRRRARS